MRFRKGIHYEHPPRGRARKPYTVSEAARRQRLANLQGTRLRSDRETRIIKLLIWQSFFGPERPTQRALAQQFGVWWSYVAKVMEAATSEGMRSSLQYGRVTLADLADAQRFTAKLRVQEPGLLTPQPAPAQPVQERLPYGVEQAAPNVPLSNPYRVMAHAKTMREWQELERRGGRRVMSSAAVFPFSEQAYVGLKK